jgi:tetratricopeptide (TPR) repeat protein
MSSFISSFIILIAVLAGVAVAVSWLSVTGLRIYREHRTRRRNEEVAAHVKKQLTEMRNSRLAQQQRVDQGNNDIEDTGHEAGQRAKESTGEPASQAQGTVGQDADQTRATEVEPWATYLRGFIFDRQGEYARAVEAYQQVIDSEHPEAAPRAALNLGILMEQMGAYNLAEEAYQQAINSGHPEFAPKAVGNLRGLPRRYPERFRRG